MFKYKKIITILISFLFILLLFYKKKINKNDINIGVMSGWYPYCDYNKNNNLEGFDIDIIKEIEKIINKKIIIKDLGSLSSLFLALKSKKIDAVFSALDITNERKKNYNMIRYTGPDNKNICLVFRIKDNLSEDIFKNNTIFLIN